MQQDDDVIKRLMDAGATDEEIITILKEKKMQTAGASAPVVSAPPVKREETLQEAAGGALEKFGEIFSGAGEGIVKGGKEILNTFARNNPLLPVAGMAGKSPKRVEIFKDTKKREDMKPTEEVGEFFGRMFPGLVVSVPVSGAVNPVFGPMGQKMLGPLAAKIVTSKPVAKVASKAMQEAIEVGITTIPQEIFAGSIAESFINPESFQDWKSVARTAALSSIGSIFNMGGAYMKAIQKAKTLEELAQLRNQVAEIVPDPSRQLPTSQQVAMGKTVDAQLPTGGQLPTHREAALKRMNDRLQEEADRRLAQLQNITPKQEVDPILEAARNPIPDPLVAAQVKGVEERLAQQLEILGGGKGLQTDTRVPLEGVSTPSFLTLDELNDHLRVLNMASIMSEPKFKKGQRFIVPRTELKSAEEIAARATGGPIKAVDKTVQASFKNIQARLDDAAARGIGTLDPTEATEVVNEMLAMSKRLSRGFEIPYTPRLGAIPDAPSRYVEGLDLPTSAKLNDPDFGAQLDPAHKRWVTGSDEPVVDLKDMPATPVPPSTPSKELTQSYAEAVRNANIDYSPKIKPLGRQVLDKIKDLKTEIYDRTWGVGKYSKESQDMLSLLSGTSTHAEEFYQNEMRVAVRDADGVFRGNTRVVEGIPLAKALDGMSMDRLVEVDAYLKSRTILDEVAKNPKYVPDIDLNTATTIVNNAPKEVKEFAQNFKVISDALVDDMEATGRISAGKAGEMKDGFYAGLSRSFNEGMQQNALKVRTGGSKRSSLPPIQLMRDNIFKTLEQNRKNAAYGKLIDTYEANPEALKDVIQPVDLPAALENVPGYTQMVDQLTKDGLTYNEASQIAAMQIPLFDKSNGTLRVFRDGKMSLWKVNEDIQKTMEALNPLEFNVFRSILTGISAPIRTTTSLALDLSLVGPVSDTFITAARTPGFIPFVDSIRGFFHSAMKSPEYFERIAAGGGYGGRFEPAEVVVYKDAKAHLAGKVGDKILHPLRWAQEIIRPLSDAARMGEYLVRRRGGETAVQAALASRRTLGDFNRVGASMRPWALMTEFGNVGIQTAGAAYEMGRNAIREAGKGNVKPLARIAAIGVAGITLPTIYFRMAAEGDDELNQYRKSDTGYRYWWTRLPFAIPGVGDEGDIVKYPKPGWWMGQVFGSSVEAALDGMDEEARRRFYDGFVSQVGLNPVPLKAQQLVGYLNNIRNPLSFSDNIPITPPSQQNLTPSMQGNERTSPLARMLADKAGINPFKTDFVIEAAGGTFFGNIIRQIGPNSVQLEKTDMPVLGRFAVKKGAPSEGSGQFYRDIEDARKFDESLTRAMEAGDVDKARKIEAEGATLIALRPVMEKHVKEIGEVNKWIYTITMDPTISAEGKREYLDNLRKYQSELFRMYAQDRKSWIDMKQ